jgi:hypothetical protein
MTCAGSMSQSPRFSSLRKDGPRILPLHFDRNTADLAGQRTGGDVGVQFVKRS